MPLTVIALSKVDDRTRAWPPAWSTPAGWSAARSAWPGGPMHLSDSALRRDERWTRPPLSMTLRGWTKRWGTRGWWRSARALTTTGSSSSSATGPQLPGRATSVHCLSPGVGLRRRVASQRLAHGGKGGLGQVMAQGLHSLSRRRAVAGLPSRHWRPRAARRSRGRRRATCIPPDRASAIWAQLPDDLGLRGDEYVLDVGCGRGAVLMLAARQVPGGGRWERTCGGAVTRAATAVLPPSATR
jgi:hypothetical protein